MLPKSQKEFVAGVAAKHGQRLRRFLAARLRNTADIADLAQEVYLRLLRVEHFERIRSPEAYLLTIASHVIHQHSLTTAASAARSDPLDEFGPGMPEAGGDPLAQIDLERRLEALDAALRRLPARTRAIFLLQRRDGCTLEEIASRLGISRSAVKKHLAKALAHCSEPLRMIGRSHR